MPRDLTRLVGRDIVIGATSNFLLVNPDRKRTHLTFWCVSPNVGAFPTLLTGFASTPTPLSVGVAVHYSELLHGEIVYLAWKGFGDNPGARLYVLETIRTDGVILPGDGEGDDVGSRLGESVERYVDVIARLRGTGAKAQEVLRRLDAADAARRAIQQGRLI